MMMEQVMALVTATDQEDKAQAYQKLERLGVDANTADAMVSEFYTPEKGAF